MWLWSKGLGRLLLPMELGKASVHVEPEKLIIKGRIVAPKVNWDYAASMYEEDLKGFMGILSDPVVIHYLVRKEGIRLLVGLMGSAVRFFLLYLKEGSKEWIIGRKA